ncbi:unnamed protein product, partial [Mesorhabditis spiculigera]
MSLNCCSSMRWANGRELDDEELIWVNSPGYVPPRLDLTSDWVCNDRELIVEEMRRQQRFLEHLHKTISTLPDGPVQKELSEQAWKTQRTITFLTRRRALVECKDKVDTLSKSSASAVRRAMLEEKQVLAVRCSLLEDISIERARIAQLCYNQSFEDRSASEASTPTLADATREDAELELAARTALLAENTRLRNECASLRAAIEDIQETARQALEKQN